jgi:hypothetical protein
MKIKILTARTKDELFKKALKLKGDILRMSHTGKHRLTIVFK